MRFFKATVADVVRTEQRDQLLVDKFQNDLLSLCKSMGSRDFNRLRQILPLYSSLWYYTFTSLSGLQTLGEEYTGTIRIDDSGLPPGKMLQIVWLALYIGGEQIYQKAVSKMEKEIKQSENIRPEAKHKILIIISFLTEHRQFIVKLHHSVFYMFGDHYHISSRITGIKHVLLREWFHNDESTFGFKMLGRFSFLYLIIYFVNSCFLSHKEIADSSAKKDLMVNVKRRMCPLCTELRKNTSVTPCGHLFCWECIYECLKHQGNCPICRETINPSRIVLLQNYT